MAFLQTNLQAHHSFSSLFPELYHFKNSILSRRFSASFFGKVRIFTFRSNRLIKNGRYAFSCCLSRTDAEVEKVSPEEEELRPPFDINLAVVLAGFAFEAYTSPPENVGRREVDAAGCESVYLSESFVREIYDGQLFVKLKKGFNFPAMDLWGTSDPYVVLQLDGQVLKSNVKWAIDFVKKVMRLTLDQLSFDTNMAHTVDYDRTKEPTWNEEFIFNIKEPQKKNIQIAAWDANLVTPHKRMGNAGLNLESLSDGKLHDILVDLEGMGGGGKLQLEVRYRTFGEIEEDKMWWRVPFISDFLRNNGFDSAMNMFAGSKTVQARQFVEYAFAQVKSLNDVNRWKEQLLSTDIPSLSQNGEGISIIETSSTENKNGSENDQSLAQIGGEMESDNQFWTNLTDAINLNLVQKFGISVSDKLKWDGFELLNQIGLEARKIAEVAYVESGLAVPESSNDESEKENSIIPPSIPVPEIRKATDELLRQTESVLGALMVLSATVSQLNKDVLPIIKRDTIDGASTKVNNGDRSSGATSKKLSSSEDELVLDKNKAEEMKSLFSSAESAMEAWAMLSISMGHPSFIKSEFEKICFLDNDSTDSQVAIWRDFARRRLVVAFRGTEQARWKDLRTDLMFVPGGLNPERLGGDFKQEVQVHSGFLSAYDSVRIRIISLIKQASGYIDDSAEPELPLKWHVYVTGHSLGGALATLLALELSSSQLAKRGAISVTMYNFGSPRVGNKRFAEVYNKKVKDSWRVVNHRDIIPTVPRLMGYCHVAQPVYLAVGDLKDALINMERLSDGYEGDVIGESTPDALVSEFMKGEKELVEKILQTEINIFRSIRDGSALMQHMEDFYYITLLENVKSNYGTVGRSQPDEQGGG